MLLSLLSLLSTLEFRALCRPYIIFCFLASLHHEHDNLIVENTNSLTNAIFSSGKLTAKEVTLQRSVLTWVLETSTIWLSPDISWEPNQCKTMHACTCSWNWMQASHPCVFWKHLHERGEIFDNCNAKNWYKPNETRVTQRLISLFTELRPTEHQQEQGTNDFRILMPITITTMTTTVMRTVTTFVTTVMVNYWSQWYCN